jgi:RHS repeat-associated protein
LTETSLKRYKYVGKERDEETGLYYYGARYYAAWLCRFVSVDPLQHKYPHYTPYQYAGNKPISYIDLDGLEEAKFTPLFFENFRQGLTKETVLNNKTPEKNKTSQKPAVADATNRENPYKAKAAGAYSELNKAKSYGETKMPGVSQAQKDPGLITNLENDPLADFEMWLDAPSKSAGEATKKIGYNILYSMVNSPYSLLTGYTISGHKLNSIEKTDAFVDFAPGLVSFGFTSTKSVVKVAKEGFLGFSKPINGF